MQELPLSTAVWLLAPLLLGLLIFAAKQFRRS